MGVSGHVLHVTDAAWPSIPRMEAKYKGENTKSFSSEISTPFRTTQRPQTNVLFQTTSPQ